MTTTRPTSDGAGAIPASSFSFTKPAADDFAQQFRALVRRRAGVIEVADGQPIAARPRLWARRPSQFEAWLWGGRMHRRLPGDHCWLYFHQPRRFSNFLVVGYTLSTRQTSLATIRVTLSLLDLLAERKRTDALLCDVASARISDRALAHWGWEPLAPSRWHRRHIKRFYGQYDVDESLLARNRAAPQADNSQLALSR